MTFTMARCLRARSGIGQGMVTWSLVRRPPRGIIDNSGDPIAAGQVPEPSPLGLPALGAAGVMTNRTSKGAARKFEFPKDALYVLLDGGE